MATITATKSGNWSDTTVWDLGRAPVDGELTANLTNITHTAASSPDYALQDLVQNTGFGFATKDEGNTLLAVVHRDHNAAINILALGLQRMGSIPRSSQVNS